MSGPTSNTSPSRDPKAIRDKIQRRIKQKQARIDQAYVEKGRLKWFLLLAVLTWPIGLFWNYWIALYIFSGWVTFWAVGYYLNYFHTRDAKAQWSDAVNDLEAHDERWGS